MPVDEGSRAVSDAPDKPRFRPMLLLAQVLLALTTIFLLFAIWLPIEGFRHWLSQFLPFLRST